MKESRPSPIRPPGFSLVELLVVLLIVGVVISILMPALASSRRKAQNVVCQSNLRQNYQLLLGYSQDNGGWMFPPLRGADLPPEKRWVMFVFNPPRWDPPTMLCPTDIEPAERHSYLLNDHIYLHGIRFGATKGVSSSSIILMGEKRSDWPDYYMNLPDFTTRVELYRHGLSVGSNYLFFDGHVEAQVPEKAQQAVDPWEPPVKPEQPKHPVKSEASSQ